jgi:hypothetical protein
MKKIYFIFLTMFALEICVYGQTVTIGSGTTSTTSSGSDPIDGYYESFRYQVVYTASELSNAGLPAYANLTGLGFSISGDYAGGNLFGYTIKIGHTTAANSSSHNTNTTNIVKAPFNYNPTVTAAGVFDMIAFTTNFSWNGTDNILVEVCSDGPNAFVSPYGQVRTIAASTANGSRYFRVDGEVSCNEITDAVNSTKPQIQLSYTPGSPPSCLAPSAVINSSITTSSASHSWAAPSPAPSVGYEWAVTTSATPPASGTAITTTTASSTGLIPNTTYYLHVRSDCGAGSFSAWSSSSSFFTGYCIPIYGTSSTHGCNDGDVVARVILNTLDNNSGTGCPSGTAGYSDYSTDPLQTTTLVAGTSYNCTVFAGQFDGNYAVWVDYDDDLNFEPSERVGFTTVPVDGSGSVGVLGSSANFIISLACNPIPGPHRMRIREMYGTNGNAISPCIYQSNWGETEDYTITITPPPPCPQPANQDTNLVTTTTAQLSWMKGCNETLWDVHVTNLGGGAPSGTSSNPGVTNDTLDVTGLTPLTQYEFFVRAVCTPGTLFSAWSGPYPFTTLSTTPPSCLMAVDYLSPANGASGQNDTTTFIINNVLGATSYRVYLELDTVGTYPTTPLIFGTPSTNLPAEAGATTTFTVTAQAGMTYAYYVAPINNIGEATGCETGTRTYSVQGLDCSVASPLLCGDTTAIELLPGAGIIRNANCGFATPGREKLYKFTTSTAGFYKLNVTQIIESGYIDYLVKPASQGCGNIGWICIDDNNTTGIDSVALLANTEYYLLTDAETADDTTAQKFLIQCPSATCSAVVSATNTIAAATTCAIAGMGMVTFDPAITTITLAAPLNIPAAETVTFMGGATPVTIELNSGNNFITVAATGGAIFDNIVLKDMADPISDPVIVNNGTVTLKNSNVVGTTPATQVKVQNNTGAILNVEGVSSSIKNN